jgi:quinol monooxygenase YgiN
MTAWRDQAALVTGGGRGIGRATETIWGDVVIGTVLFAAVVLSPSRRGPCSKQEKTMTKFALYVPLQAKPGKEREVADFLRSAVPLVNAEPGTISWFAVQEGPSSFAIFDTFDDEAGRDAHLNGKVAAALMEKAKAGDLFAKTPEIHKLGILADKLPK